MPAELEIRPAQPQDTEAILSLLKLTFGAETIPASRDHWHWKHVENPFGESPVLLALSEGTLVGLRVFMRWNWRAGNVDVPAVRAVDTATHPDWQGRGIFSRLTLALAEKLRSDGLAFVFNTPNNKSRPGYLKMGWVSVGRVSLWVRPLVGGLFRAPASSEDALLDRALGAGACELAGDPGLEGFCAALPRAEERFSTPWSAELLRWRYATIPGFDYRAVWNLRGEEGALVVFRRKNDGKWRELRLCQVLVGRGRWSRRAGRELVRSLLGRSTAQFATAMASFGTPAQSVLLGSGFLPAPRVGPIMTVRPLATSSAAPDPLERGAWDLSIGDLELF
jgi:GNAT superfamily N-acetyltransferase